MSCTLYTDYRTGGSITPLSLAQVLEAGTWKAGRELAEVSRPNTKEPPIGLLGSDGTVCPENLTQLILGVLSKWE